MADYADCSCGRGRYNPGGTWSQIRRGLYGYYNTTGRQWLDVQQRGYAHRDYDAKEPVRDLKLWNRWLNHDAALVLQDFRIDTEPDIFCCPSCGCPAATFYGTTEPVCIDCWPLDHAQTRSA